MNHYQRMPQRYPNGPRRLKPAVWVGIVAGMLIWSLLAWIIYVAVDPVLAGVSAGAGAVLQSGRDAAAAVGGKPVVDLVGAVSNSGLIDQLAALLHTIAKPAIIVVWALGVLGMLAAPLVLTWLVRTRG